MLAGAIDNRQHSVAQGAESATASIEGSVLAGDIRHPPTQMVSFMLVSGL
jgi:hypothetical protein